MSAEMKAVEAEYRRRLQVGQQGKRRITFITYVSPEGHAMKFNWTDAISRISDVKILCDMLEQLQAELARRGAVPKVSAN